jgi:excisionase family DNA binding protein
MVMDDRPVTVSEAARLCGVSADTIRRWEAAGRLLARRTGTGVRIFVRADVERLALERARRAEARSA